MVAPTSLVLLLAGCIEFGLDPIDPEGEPRRLVVVEEVFVQETLPEVDVLFVLDDTASMAQERLALAGDFDALTGELDAAGVAWQLGVVSITLGADQHGWLLGNPWILTPATPEPADRFAEIVQRGDLGAGAEAGLAAAVEALELAEPGGVNEGFRRPEAALQVVFVTDADDESDALLGDPVGDFLDRLDVEAASTGRSVRASAIAGDVPGGCSGPDGTAVAAERYAEVVEATDGVLLSICDLDFDPLYAALARGTVETRTRFELRETPEPGSVRVDVDGERTDAWVLEDDPPAVVLDEAPAPEASIVVTYLVSNE